MKIEIDEVKPTPEEIYQVGNVFKDLSNDVYMVICTDENYGLLNLRNGVLKYFEKTMAKLISSYSDPQDQLIDVKIVRA